MARNGSAAIDKTIQKNLPKLRKTGVLTVRPDFEITGQQLTGTQRSTTVVRKAPTKKTPSRKTPPKTRRGARP
jgi:hypothetical protein